MTKTKPRQKLWTKKDGTKIRLCDMDMSHLERTIHMLERGATIKMHKLQHEALTWCPPQGEMAEMAFDDGIEELLEDVNFNHFEKYVNPIYFDMIKEMERRIQERQSILAKYT